MGVKLNWISVSDRQYIWTPQEAFLTPSLFSFFPSLFEGTSGLSLFLLSFFLTTHTEN